MENAIARNLADLVNILFKGLSGIEIGGPSSLFSSTLPLYQTIAKLDGVNFAHGTIWEGSIQEGGGRYRFYKNKVGSQYIGEATALRAIENASYDFVASSNCLEHIANPLKALAEWHRILKPRGMLLLVTPEKADTFDHRRAITTYEHLVGDLDRNVGEDDLTHLDEIIRLHDLSRDAPAGNLDQFITRSLRNFENRALHHHVFDHALIARCLDSAKFDVLDMSVTQSDLFVLAVSREPASPRLA